jgi:hypothetical protein
MKNYLTFSLPILLLVNVPSFAGQTNETSYAFTNYEYSPQKGFVSTKNITGASQPRESLPVNDFPEGNWGQPMCEAQLSLRFEKTTFTNGEPITAVLLLRNITNHEICLLGSVKTGGNGPINFVVKKEDGHQLTSKWDKPSEPGKISIQVSANGLSVNPQTQLKLHERLDKMYDLPGGTYLVQASLELPWLTVITPEKKSDELKFLTSAPVQIQVE